MESILISGGTLLTMDRRRTIIRDGAVMVEDGRIIDVGKSDVLKAKHSPDVKIDAEDKLIMPGLIDCHAHLAQALIRGCADDMALIDWLKNRVWPLQGNYTPEDGRISALLCMLEMVRSGTTTFAEPMIHSRYGFDGIAEAVEQAGMRAILSKTVMDMPGYAGESQIMHPGMIEDRDASVKEALAMIEKWNGRADGRIKVWFGPRSLGACSKELYEEVAELARKYKTGVTMHLAEVREDVEYTEKNFGMKPVEFAGNVGLLDSNILFAHMVWLTDEEVRMLAETATNVVHCPSSNLKLGSGIAKIPEMLKAGVNVCLGCDGGPSNNAYDMVREMKLAAIIHKARLLDPTVMPAETVVEMATINGARAVGLEREIGSIEAGKRADIILVDLRRPHLIPSYNVISNLVYAATGGDVDTVIVDGRVVMEGGVVRTIDEKAILKEAEERGAEVLRRAGVRVSPKWPSIE